MPNKDGLVHVSQISEKRIDNIKKHFQIGESVRVKVLDIDRQGRVKLTMRDMEKLTKNMPVKIETDSEQTSDKVEAMGDSPSNQAK